MNYSSNYPNLILEIESDIKKGFITPDDYLKVVRRKKSSGENYYPIIDYYYNESNPECRYECIQTKTVLAELVFNNMLCR